MAGMVDIDRLVADWRAGADEEWTVANELFAHGRLRQGLFFAHLAVEKALKALVCLRTHDLAPRTHNLVRLSELAGLEPTPEVGAFLADLNRFGVIARYPDERSVMPEPDRTGDYMARAGEVFQWLMRQL